MNGSRCPQCGYSPPCACEIRRSYVKATPRDWHYMLDYMPVPPPAPRNPPEPVVPVEVILPPVSEWQILEREYRKTHPCRPVRWTCDHMLTHDATSERGKLSSGHKHRFMQYSSDAWHLLRATSMRGAA